MNKRWDLGYMCDLSKLFNAESLTSSVYYDTESQYKIYLLFVQCLYMVLFNTSEFIPFSNIFFNV